MLRSENARLPETEARERGGRETGRVHEGWADDRRSCSERLIHRAIGAEGGNRTHTVGLPPRDFKSRASASSATPALSAINSLRGPFRVSLSICPRNLSLALR